MNTLTIHISEDTYLLLQEEAQRQGKPAPQLVQEHLSEWLRLPPRSIPLTARQRSEAVLRADGLLAAISPEERQQAEQCRTTLAAVRATLDRSGGPPLSQLILEMREPER